MTYRVQWSTNLRGSFQTVLIEVPYRRKATWIPRVINFFTAKFWHDFLESRIFTSSYHFSHVQQNDINGSTVSHNLLCNFLPMQFACAYNQPCLKRNWQTGFKEIYAQQVFSTPQRAFSATCLSDVLLCIGCGDRTWRFSDSCFLNNRITNYEGLSAVKCHLIFVFYFLNIMSLMWFPGMQNIIAIVTGN
jgi:hypothetical protein